MIDKRRVKRSFTAHAHSYDKSALLQKKVFLRFQWNQSLKGSIIVALRIYL
jgi:hypothetical protein